MQRHPELSGVGGFVDETGSALFYWLVGEATAYARVPRREEDAVWAQLISAQLKAGRDDDLATLAELLQASEQPDSGIVRELIMRDQKDLSRIYVLVVFESEEKARARETDPRRSEALLRLREHMSGMLAGPPEFVDLTVFQELFT